MSDGLLAGKVIVVTGSSADLASEGDFEGGKQIMTRQTAERWKAQGSVALSKAIALPGWTSKAIVDRVFPLFRLDFYKLDRSMDVFAWDPV